MYMSLCTIIIVSLQPIQVLSVCSYVQNNCERSELSGLFNGTDFLYIYIYVYFRPAVCRAVNVLNVSTCI